MNNPQWNDQQRRDRVQQINEEIANLITQQLELEEERNDHLVALYPDALNDDPIEVDPQQVADEYEEHVASDFVDFSDLY